MSANPIKPLLVLAATLLPVSLTAQDVVATATADGAQTAAVPLTELQPQFAPAAPMEGDFRPTSPPVADVPAVAGGYDASPDPGRGWAREGDYAAGDYGFDAYRQDDNYWADPGYGQGSGYGSGYGGYDYPQDSRAYRQPVPQGGYYQDMRGGYADPYASSGYGIAESMPRAPRVDYHREMIQRLDAIVERLERIEKALLKKGD